MDKEPMQNRVNRIWSNYMNLIDHQLLENEAWIANFGVDAADVSRHPNSIDDSLDPGEGGEGAG